MERIMRKTIIIFNVAVSGGGALTILNQYYNKALEDKDNNYIFVISTPKLKETNNIKVLKYPWVKKSWLHRLWFDKFFTSKIINKENPTEILSLQNTYIKNKKKLKQTIYVHQPLPFTPIKMSLFTDFKMWIYQNVIGKIIKRSINKSNKVIVQTKWMKEAILSKTKIEKENILIQHPPINIPKGYVYKSNYDNLFFYPAIATKYKNHRIIIEASKILKEKDINNYNIEFTLNGNENKHISKLKKECVKYDLPIKFIGSLSYEEVMDKYSKSVLLFPSYIETFGLPLLEAKTIGSPIIASDTPFSREITSNYNNVNYFDYFDEVKLAKLMIKQIGKMK